MTISTTANSCWPSRLAFAAALIFSLASAGTNLIYGISKGADLASSAVWGAVSLGVSIVFALSWPALIRCLDNHQWSRAVIVVLALLVTGTYSVSAALGSAMGGRVNAESAEMTAANDRKRAQTAYDKVETELAKLPATRSVEELETLVATARPVCRVYVTNGVRQTVCTKPPAIETELARAKKRSRLQAGMDNASADLKGMGAPKAANTDAAALAVYLNGLGFDVTADRLNKLLVLLAVLVVECGGGMSLVVGMSLSGPPGHSPHTLTSTQTPSRPDSRTDLPEDLPEMSNSKAAASQSIPDTAVQLTPDTVDRYAAGVRLLEYLTERGGVLVASQREMGRALGWSKSWTHEVLHGMASAGLVRLATGRSGTIVRTASPE